MKKILLGTAASLFLVSVNANDDACGCADTSFTGAFIGVSADFSFDQGKIKSVVKDENGNALDEGIQNEDNGKHHKKNKTAFGGSIILGYGYQLNNGMYMSIFHESSFLSKAGATYDFEPYRDITRYREEDPHIAGHEYDGGTLKYSRKVYVPSFGISLGYVTNGWGFGLRGGISIEKAKIERSEMTYTRISTETDGDPVEADYGSDVSVATSKTETLTSPFIGAYVEYKMNSAVAFLNLDYKFSKEKTAVFDFKRDNGTAAITRHRDDTGAEADEAWAAAADRAIDSDVQHVTHKRPSWKLSLGVKCNLNNLLAKLH